MNITIIGAGMMGSAMAVPAGDNGHQVHLVGTPLDIEIIDQLKKNGYHKTLKIQLDQEVPGIDFYQFDELSPRLLSSDIIVCGVSSFGVEWFAETILPVLPAGARVLAITKGLKAYEPDSSFGKSLSDSDRLDDPVLPFPKYFACLRPDVSFNAVGGPCISFELAQRIHTEVAFCGSDLMILQELKEAFSTDYYHLTVTTDINGIETAVALKNAYAMAVSLAIGMYTKGQQDQPEKYNAQAGLFYAASKEMGQIITRFGGKENALYFGVGDLYVTVFGGRTRKLGVLLGTGLPFSKAREILSGVTLESVAIIELLGTLFGEDLNHYPLMKYIYTRITTDQVLPLDWNQFSE